MAETGKEKKIGTISVAVIIILATTMIGIIAYYEIIRIEENNSYWVSEYNLLVDYSDELLDDYNLLVDDYNLLIDNYGELYAPSTLIKNGTVNWRFNMINGTIASWEVDIDTYRSYVLVSEPDNYEELYNSGTGETYLVKDLTQYVQPDFFEGVISDLTYNNSDREFIAEVVNLKNQLINYGTGLGDFYRWSAETLTEGRGQCGDTSILIASLIKAGEIDANYGIDVYFWYCDADSMSDPFDVNHVIVGVEYSDGGYDLIETTADEYYSHDEVVGWEFEV
jgi:hypothetical protein